MRHTSLLIAMTALFACGSGAPDPTTPPPPPATTGLRIAMLGNSLSEWRDIPGMIADLAVSTGAPRPTVTAITHANFSLEDHWNLASSTDAIDGGNFDVVTMQQGPSTLPSSGANLLEWSGKWADRIRADGGAPGMYVVWPTLGDDIDNGIFHYVEAADAKNMAIYPVGQAIRAVESSHHEIALRDADEFHPSPRGAWLAAMVITGVIYDHDPSDFPNLVPREITDEEATVLRAAAKDAIRLFGRR
jgi:hypothetical protein